MERFFLAILPPDDISTRVRKWQEELSESYGTKASLRSPPHITLHMPFLWKESREDDLIEGLTKHMRQQRQFPVALDGVGAFAPRVIYVSVKPTDSLIAFQKALTRFCRTTFDLHNSDYGDLPFYPHLTLAFRDLKKAHFKKAWDQFRERQFQEEFTVTEVTLLKHTGKEWRPYMQAKVL